MKKCLGLLVALLLLASCSLDHDVKQFDIEFLPVVGVDAPLYVVPGQTATFVLHYRRPNDCYYVNGFDYSTDGNIRTVAIQALVVEDANCQPLENAEPETIQMPFECPPLYENDSYTFRFYSGTAITNGADSFVEIEVPVQQ